MSLNGVFIKIKKQFHKLRQLHAKFVQGQLYLMAGNPKQPIQNQLTAELVCWIEIT
jgi:hypothetical protein